MHLLKPALAVFCCLALNACSVRSPSSGPAARAGLAHLGQHSLPITTRSAEAQRAFDRGLTLAYSFGHFAAEQEFQRAVQVDPECAMGYWGIALVNGPHINFPLVPPEHASKAWQALTNAQARASQATPLEQALISALARRYANPQPEDRAPLDVAYAQAMREVWRRYPTNADAGCLFAEAAMDLHPWDLWKDGAPQPWTPEIVQTLEAVLKLEPSHPGANHLYIHAVEASPHPEQGLAAARRLEKLVPDASHMVHMPSHIYARSGLWEEAAESNRRASAADARYRATYPRPGFYAIYMAHNSHFLAFANMMLGRSEESLRVGRSMVQGIPDEFLDQYGPIADGYLIFVSEVLMRFGRWQEILAEPAPRRGLPVSTALWHFTRAVAYTGLDQVPEARAEQGQFIEELARVPQDASFGNNSASNVLEIAGLVMEGELAAKQKDWPMACASLRKAVELEDNLRYDEPPNWIQPVRHTLGAVLLRSGDAVSAEKVYREDLQHYPENGWSLMGLRDALRRQGKDSEAAAVDKRWRKQWATADVKPTATCYCQAK